MWITWYVACKLYAFSVQKIALFVVNGNVLDVNICDNGSNAMACQKCICKCYSLFKENPDLLNAPNAPEDPLYLT